MIDSRPYLLLSCLPAFSYVGVNYNSIVGNKNCVLVSLEKKITEKGLAKEATCCLNYNREKLPETSKTPESRPWVRINNLKLNYSK